MIGFAGAVRLDGAAFCVDTAHRWKRGLAEAGHVVLRADGGAVLACQARTAARAMRAKGALLELPDGTTLIADLRLDDPASLTAALGLAPGTRDDAALAAAAWQRWGADAIAHLFGDVALAHWDPRARTLTLARDALGLRTLYYAADDGGLRFASSLETLLTHPDVPRDLDDPGIADLLTGGSNDTERTLFRAIRRVPPGSVMRFRQGERETRRWWEPERLAPVRHARDEDYVEEARALLDQAVASRLPASGKVAAMLSGGFDSAGVTATAARLLGTRRLHAFTRVAGADHPYDGLDERAHAASVVALYPNIDWTVIDAPPQAQPGFAADWEAAAHGYPQLASFNFGWFDPVHAAAEAEGADVLLVGNAGNFAFSWGGQTLFAEQIAAGRWGSAIKALWQLSRHEQKPFLAMARQYLTGVIEPRALRRRRLAQRNRGAPLWTAWSPVSADFLEAIDFDARARAEGRDLPYTPRGSGREIRARMLQKQVGRDSDEYFRRKRRFTKLDPYQDRRLIEFTLALPEEQFLRHGIRRSLARSALADRLPPALLAENRRGRQSPEWHAIASLRRERLAEQLEALERSPLATRVLDVKRLRALFDSWPADAETARRDERLYGATLYRGIVIGSFLRQWEGRND